MQNQDDNLIPLWKVMNNTWVQIEGIDEPILFKHLDGMYSLCYHENEPVHIAAFAKVKVLHKNKG